MTDTAPPVGGRTIGLAHYAGRAVLERVLARHGLTFQQQITLRAAVAAVGPLESGALVEQVTDALKTGAADVRTAVDTLLSEGLLAADGPLVRPTDAARELFAVVSAETGEISARIYAGIPPEDLATTGRVLARVTERADAELANLAQPTRASR
ncbi:DNA-binding MarR family transcriptional regulator [Streptomyces sp. 3330]|uniref:MarR family transcriptional regulator n=1 Tax=Streptomyces sp. 3330 TaxID=2817755 RepID=UPI0028554A90|nr:MarR family transcriptional regulator [Streptomyces sp. 3330]MDR6978045.1 DNA-binding MarR family transcriptional regulator [Streptomyces sp. 3330]